LQKKLLFYGDGDGDGRLIEWVVVVVVVVDGGDNSCTVPKFHGFAPSADGVDPRMGLNRPPPECRGRTPQVRRDRT